MHHFYAHRFEFFDIVFFSLLIIHHQGVHNDIPVDVLFSQLSIFNYSRWRPRWPPQKGRNY